MDIRPIRTDEDHAAALREIDDLWGAPDGSPEGDRLDVLATLVSAYEDRRWPMPSLDPVEFLQAHMEASGRTPADLAVLLGGKAQAVDVLTRRQPLSVTMIHALHEQWSLPADVLVQPYRLAPEAA